MESWWLGLEDSSGKTSTGLKNNFQIDCGVATFCSSVRKSKNWITARQICDGRMKLVNIFDVPIKTSLHKLE
jgi:hypothetical protein